MFEDALKINRGISDKRIQRFKRCVFLVGAQEFCAPEFLISKKIVLRGVPTGERVPLHVVR